MEKCLHKSNMIYASDINVKYKAADKIKIASENGELFCYGCGQNVIFRSGTKRIAHFAHKSGEAIKCDYDEYDKQCRKRLPIWRDSKDIIFNQLRKNKDYNIDKDVRIVDKYWTDLVITFKDEDQLAIEIDDKTLNRTKLQHKVDTFQLRNIDVTWFIIDDIKYYQYEKNFNHIVRVRVNESKDNNVFMIDKDNLSIMAIYKLYKDENHSYPNIFMYQFNIEQLSIIDKEINIEGFEQEYKKWIIERDNRIEKDRNKFNNNNIIRKEWKDNEHKIKINRVYHSNKNVIKKNIEYEMFLINNGNQYAMNMILDLMKFNKYYVEVVNELYESYRQSNNPNTELLEKIINHWENLNII